MPTSLRTRTSDDRHTADAGRSATARATVFQAEQAWEASRFEAAKALATQALASAQGDASASGRCQTVLALAHLRAGELEEAYSAACTAQGLLTLEADMSVRLRALNVCANVRWAIGDEASAVDIWRHALKSVGGLLASNGRCIMMFNLGETLIRHGEYLEAIQFMAPSVTLAERAPERPGQYVAAASGLAYAHVCYADHLSSTGRHAEAREQLQCAASALPPLDPAGWRSFCVNEIASLWSQVDVLSALGDHASARRAATAGFLRARQPPRVSRYHADALVTVAGLYRRCGQTQRAIRCERRALTLWRSLGEKDELLQVMGRLAKLYADSGDHALALALRKDMMVSLASRQAERSALSRRLAAIEREVEVQRAEAQEKLAHAQQLSIVGRLIGQIHHALQAPIQRTQQLCRVALQAHERAPSDKTSAPDMPALLTAISQSIDAAASLSRQLKIYAYRSTPTTTTLSISASLLEVWATLQPHLSARQRELRVVGNTSLHVRADPQRLSVLLTLVLIELVKKQPASGDPALVTAQIHTMAPDRVALLLECAVPADVHHPADASATLIDILCTEIASEMDATMSCACPKAGLLRCSLVMPDADHAVASGMP